MALAYPRTIADLQVSSEDRPGNPNILLAAFKDGEEHAQVSRN